MMSFSDYVISLIRTIVPVAVGVAVTAFAKWAGVDLDAEAIAAAVTGIATIVYYAAVRALEGRFPSAGYLLGYRAALSYARTETLSAHPAGKSLSPDDLAAKAKDAGV